MLTKESFIEQIDFCRSPYRFVEMAREKLTKNGFVELFENQNWDQSKIPQKFFVVREEKAIFAGNIGTLDAGVIAGGHIDFPALRISPKSYLNKDNTDYVQTYRYGWPILSSWIDRDLGISGLVYYKENGKIAKKVIQTKEAIATIPNIPLHLSSIRRGKQEIDQKSLNPILGFNPASEDPDKKHSDILLNVISQEVGCKPEDIINFDLTFFDINPPQIASADGNLISAEGLDDLSCSISILSAFLNSKKPEKGSIFALLMNHEEIGSYTKEGAKSNLVTSVLERIGCPASTFYRKSFLLSGDVVFGASPNFPEQIPKAYPCCLGDGPCFAWNENLHFATDARAMQTLEALLKIGEKEENLKISVGKWAKDATQSGGTTIGPIMSAKTGIETIDLGIPVASMHSIRELSHFDDIFNFEKIVKLFYEYETPRRAK